MKIDQKVRIKLDESVERTLKENPIITENDGFFISRRYAIPEYPTGVFGAITTGRGDDFSGLSIHGNPDPNFVFVRARDPKRPFNPAHTGSFLINVSPSEKEIA